MKQKLQHFFFGSSLPDNTVLNIGWLLFRLHIGLSLAIHAGWPKMNTMTAPGWFNEQVAGLGFTFPSPAFWATLASWGEFTGGICIALGLLTRFNALQLAFQFFVISFLWYDKPEPLTGMYFQQTLFWGYVLAVFMGGGRFSFDHLIRTRKKISQPLVIKTAIASLLIISTLQSNAQSKPLKGSGNVVNKNYSFTDFDKLNLSDLHGKVTVETGKPFSVEIGIDDNLEPLLGVEVKNGTLVIMLKGNERNKLYVENTNIRVRITMPEISVLKQSGNNELEVTGITGRYFKAEQYGNGNSVLKGQIDELEIWKEGNGKLDAGALPAGKANLKKSGNGDLIFNTNNPFTIEGSGNGDMMNIGNGRAQQQQLSGNGKLVYAVKEPSAIQPDKETYCKVRIRNESDKWIELYVVYPVRGSYGIDIRSGRTTKREFPAGTKLFKNNPRTPGEQPLYTVSTEPKQEFIIR